MTESTGTPKPSLTRWLVIPKKEPTARMRLFCFPYAGGTVMTFHKWPEDLPAEVEVCAVQPPGRGNRLREKPFCDLLPLVEAIAPAIVDYLDKPFAFFGHSMGAMITFELARHLRREFGLMPTHLFVSACRAPQIKNRERITYNLSEGEFLDSVRELNGTPKEVLDNHELMQLMVPLLRADFAVCQTYNYVAGPPLDCPITVFGALSDREVQREDLEAWREQTTSSFVVRMLPGDHFFLNSAQTTLLKLLGRELNGIARKMAY